MANSRAGLPRLRLPYVRAVRASTMPSASRLSRCRRTAAGVSPSRADSPAAVTGPFSRMSRAIRPRVPDSEPRMDSGVWAALSPAPPVPCASPASPTFFTTSLCRKYFRACNLVCPWRASHTRAAAEEARMRADNAGQAHLRPAKPTSGGQPETKLSRVNSHLYGINHDFGSRRLQNFGQAPELSFYLHRGRRSCFQSVMRSHFRCLRKQSITSDKEASDETYCAKSRQPRRRQGPIRWSCGADRACHGRCRVWNLYLILEQAGRWDACVRWHLHHPCELCVWRGRSGSELHARRVAAA